MGLETWGQVNINFAARPDIYSSAVVELTAPSALVTAAIVWLLWRFLIWRRNGFDLVRESVIAVLFAWSMVIAAVTMFPLTIIFYDWASVINLVPFSSITQLIRHTPTQVAFKNIVGNIVLFVPLGILLPTLFSRLQRPWPMIWRGAAISINIELAQLVTRARAVDIDDVILNTLGAAIGFGIYRVIAAWFRRTTTGRRLLDRTSAASSREPLLIPLVPLAVTLLIIVPMLLSTIFSATFSKGADGIVGDALSRTPNGTVVALADVEEYSFVLVEAPPIVSKFDYQRVLPGRFSPWIARGDLSSEPGSRFTWSMTVYNTAKRERPRVLIWGVNDDSATTLVVSGNGVTERMELPNERYFVVGFIFDIETHVPFGSNMQDFDFTFFDAVGTDVSNAFELSNR